MPGREIPLVTNEIYHVFNKGVASQPIFFSTRDYDRALQTILYYQNHQLPLKYSRFLTLSNSAKNEVLSDLKKKKQFWIEITAYCLMPNHIHLILKQLENGGISQFMSNFTNSYTRYFNTKRKRLGALFQGKFKAVRIDSDQQLVHLSRYIHLNPYSSHLIKSVDKLLNYPYSSLLEYSTINKNKYCNKNIVLDNFRSRNHYKDFVLNYADYQRKLSYIKHLTFE